MSDVPAAFPNNGFGQFKPDSGMSLRDYFAAKAMQAIASDPNVDMTFRAMAEWAYEMADAMLKAREVSCD